MEIKIWHFYNGFRFKEWLVHSCLPQQKAEVDRWNQNSVASSDQASESLVGHFLPRVLQAWQETRVYGILLLFDCT